MGIEALAVFPAAIGIVTLIVLIVFNLTNIRQLFQILSISIGLITVSVIVLFATVFFFEFLGLAMIGDTFYFTVIGFVLYCGLRFGRKKYGFKNREIIMLAIIAVCGCLAAVLCFLGWTVKI